jgi:hypothetical protein
MSCHRVRYFWSVRAATICAIIGAWNTALESGPALSQTPVAIDDLQGAVMEASTTHERVIRRDGKERPNKVQYDWTIRFISTDAIHVRIVVTSYGARGTQKKTDNQGRVFNLVDPKETKLRGGGHLLWVFENGVLTRLRTFQGGGAMGSFAFTRSANGFDCTIEFSWAREAGVPSINFRSVIADAWVQILSAKQVASSCRVATRSAAAPQ